LVLEDMEHPQVVADIEQMVLAHNQTSINSLFLQQMVVILYLAH
jgi:hypothetical protein